MKISEITLTHVKDYLRIDHTLDDRLLQVFMDAARSHIKSYTGLNDLEINDPVDGIDDLSIAYLVMISDMYDNRAMSNDKVGTRMNMLVEQILGKYSRNLL